MNKIKNSFRKISWHDATLVKEYLVFISFLSAFVTIISFFCNIQNSNHCKIYAVIFICILIIVYLGMWYNANNINSVHLRINQTKVNIYIGDIFHTKEGEINVIAVNDFFDLVADDKLVAKWSLHGQFVKLVETKKLGTIEELNKTIEENEILNELNNKDEVPQRKNGRKVRYKIGSILEYKSFILAAFTKFNERDKAYLSAQEYLEFWMKFWENIDEVYCGRTINIPLIGAGITRFRNGKPSKQELLEIMIWTLKVSGFHNTYGNKSINIVIYEPDAEEIDFYHIKHNLSFKNR